MHAVTIGLVIASVLAAVLAVAAAIVIFGRRGGVRHTRSVGACDAGGCFAFLPAFFGAETRPIYVPHTRAHYAAYNPSLALVAPRA